MTAENAFGSSEQEPLPWWLVLIEGVALVIVGLLFISSPRMTTVVVVQILGLYWIFAGILSIIKMFIDSSNWGWKLFSGVIGILAGILILNHPLWSSVILAKTGIILLGLGGIIVGVINIVQAFRGAGWGAGLIGVVTLILGLILLANSWLFTFSLPWTLGIMSVIGGIAVIIGAFRLRSDAKAADVSGVVPEPPEEVAAEPEAAGVASPAVAAAVADEAVEEVQEPAEEVSAEAEEVVEIPDTPGEVSKFHKPLTYIEGIGPAYEKKLNEAGIMTTMDLLERGASPKGRLDISEKTQLSGKLISRWVNQVDLYRIPGVGSQYADLLEKSGVDTVPELAQRNAQNLHNKMVAVNDEKKLVREVAGEHQVVEWVAQAKKLPRKLTY